MVDFPLPVGPVTKIMPVELAIASCHRSRLILEKQSTIKFGINVSSGLSIYDETNDAARFNIDSGGRIGLAGNDLSNTYIQAALNQRQKRLSEGLSFLRAQTPALEKKVLNL